MWVLQFNGKQVLPVAYQGNSKSLSLIWLSLCFQTYYLFFLLYSKTDVINKMIPHSHPQDVHVLLPGICACYLKWQKGLCRCDSIRILRWGGDPGFFFLVMSFGLWNLSSLIRDWTLALGSESAKSWPLDHQRIPDPGLFEWMQYNQSWVLEVKEENESVRVSLGDLRTEVQVGVVWLLTLKMKEGAMGQERCRWPLEKSRKQTLPWSLQKTYTLILAKWDLFQTCDL